jgi:hypothetical protein
VLQTPAPIDFSFTERIKEELMKRTNNAPRYPYAYIVIGELDIVKDRGNTTSMVRSGQRSNILNTAGTAAQVNYMLPARIAFTLHYWDSDVLRMLLRSQAMLLADTARAFNFKLRAFNTEHQVIVKRQGSITVPEPGIDTSSDTDSGAGTFTLSFECVTWLGFSAFVPTVRQFNVNLNIIDSETVDGEVVETIVDVIHIERTRDALTSTETIPK